MQHILINKKTGEVINDKIYTTKGRAEGTIKKTDNDERGDWVAIPLPSADILKNIANGSKYATIVHIGKLPVKIDDSDFEGLDFEIIE
jgi:hypothetical protein